jgi:hypothetical protein
VSRLLDGIARHFRDLARGRRRAMTSALLASVDGVIGDLKDDPSCHRQITIGKSRFDRYSSEAIEKIREAVKTNSIDEIWKSHRAR